LELSFHFLFCSGIEFVIDFARGTSFFDAGMEFAANALHRREFPELFSESSLSETLTKEHAYDEEENEKVKKTDQAEENCNRHERVLAELVDDVEGA